MKKEGISPAAVSAPANGDIDNFLVAATPGGIEAQEARGQRDFVASETLPTQMSAEDRRVLEAAGVRFGESVNGDPIFRHVQLPAGWKKIPTDHSMWSKLVDDKGRERAGIFYKAAFYDRSSHLGVTCRFRVSEDWNRTDGMIVAQVLDCEKVVHSTEPVQKIEKDYKQGTQQRELAAEWLTERYPDWKNAAAYWD